MMRRMVALQLAPHVGAEQLLPDTVANHGHAREETGDRIHGQFLKRRLGAEKARRPIRLRIESGQAAEQQRTEFGRHQAANPLLARMPEIAPVPGKQLVAGINGRKRCCGELI